MPKLVLKSVEPGLTSADSFGVVREFGARHGQHLPFVRHNCDTFLETPPSQLRLAMRWQFLFFAALGFLASIIYWLELWGTNELIGPSLGAILIARTVALIFPFVINTSVTFRSVKTTRQIMRRYVADQLAINLTLAGLTLFLLQLEIIHPITAGIFSNGLIGVAEFFLAKFWVIA